MTINDFTIPEAEVIYQKAVIRGAWWFFSFMLLCVFVYFVVRKIVDDRKDARYHARQLARIKATGDIGQTGFYATQAHNGQIIRNLQKDIDFLKKENEQKGRHIERLEETMENLHFGDVAERIRKEMEQ